MITPVDFAFVAAKLHGMRSYMYEGDRIESICELRDIYEMMSVVCPGKDVRTRMGFEGFLAADHFRELRRVQVFLEGHNRFFFDWQLERYRIENLKVLLRGWKGRMNADDIGELMIDLSDDYSLPVDEILGTPNLMDVIRLMPSKVFGKGIRRGVVQFHDTNRLFYIDAGVDAGYFEELIRRSAKLRSADRREVSGLIAREVLVYNILFIMRSRLNYDVAVEDVREFLITGPHPAPSKGRLAPMLTAGTFEEMLDVLPNRKDLLGRGPAPTDLPALERRLWQRMYQAANRDFYRSDFHMGCVEAFYYIKRVELNNLIRVAELLRQEVPATVIKSKLIRLDVA